MRSLTAIITAALAATAGVATAAPATLTVITHDSFDVSKDLVAAWEKANDAHVQFVKGGDAGAMVNKLILTRSAPIADVVYGIDNTLLQKALSAGILAAYKSPLLTNVSARYRIDPTNRFTPVDYGYVALNYDKAWFKQHGTPLPKTLQDLTRPEYKNLLVVENPATSSPGLAFLLATYKTFGANAYLEYWKALRDNGVKVTDGWEAAYNTEFTRNGGTRPIVVSYATSPAAEVFYSDQKLTESPTANLLLPGSSFLQIEGVAVLNGTKNEALARKFVDFMLSRAVQSDFPTRMWVYPVSTGVTLDPVFKHAEVPTPAATATLAPVTIAARADKLVEAWTKVVVQGAEPTAAR